MTILTTFILLGMVDSHDEHFATVELSTNPASNGGPATAVMPVNAFPCEIYEGKVFYVVKLHDNQDAVIICQEDAKSGQKPERTD
tara:strand:- start:210 stop:464 length:255 start_codon:yes stop_codon:yes gene_type:complete